MRKRAAICLAACPAAAHAGSVDFGSVAVFFLLGAAFYALYLVVPLVAYLLWRRGHVVWVAVLAVLWIAGAVLVPLVDFQRARMQAQSNWDLRILPETFEITGKSFLSDDTVGTPHEAVRRFNDPGAMFGLYYRKETIQALAAGPVDFADLRFFQHVVDPDRYNDRRTVEVPAGFRISPDYFMISDFYGEGRALLDVIQHPTRGRLPAGFAAQFAIFAVEDPAAFDLSKARIAMMMPYASKSYYTAPFNPFVRSVYGVIPYRDRATILKAYFCAGLDEETLDKCRRDI